MVLVDKSLKRHREQSLEDQDLADVVLSEHDMLDFNSDAGQVGKLSSGL